MTLFIHRNAGGRCPCGAENAACGPPSNAVPVDQLIEEVPAVSGPLKKYRVTRGGVETVMKLNEDDAKRLGVSADAVIGGASTIQPVQPVADAEADGDSEGDDGAPGDPAGGDGAGAQLVQQAADTGGDTAGAQLVQQAADTGGDTAGAQPVQQAADTGDDQTPDAPAAKAETPPPAKKTAAKRRPTSANKARTTSANKAADGGS